MRKSKHLVFYLITMLLLVNTFVNVFATPTVTNRITSSSGRTSTVTPSSGVKAINAPELNSLTPGVISDTHYTVTFDANGSYFKYHEPEWRIASGTTRTYKATTTSKNSTNQVTKVTYKIPASEVLYGYLSYPENYNGKHCIGWNTVSDASAPMGNIEVGDDTTLYAVWEANTTTYTMNYNVNLGQWSGYLQADRNNRRTEVDTELILQHPTRDGYDFLGWYYDPENITPANKWDESMGLTKYDQVFAGWEATGDPYVVTFNCNGGTIDGAAIITVNVPRNSTGTFQSNTPERTGYTFKGWATSSTAESGLPVITINREEVTGDLTYYATWQINSSEPEQPDPDPVQYDDNTPIKTWFIGDDNVTDVKVELYEDGRLIFDGSGEFDTSNADRSWLLPEYATKIKTVKFQGDLEPISLAGAFEGATNIESIDIGSMDLSSCTSTANMCKDCRKLKNFVASSATMPKITNMSGMFDGCSKITNIQLPYMNTGSLKNMDRAFADCPKLETLDLTNVNSKFVTSMKELCDGDDTLSTIMVTQNFAVPASSYVSYDANGKLFRVTTAEIVPLTITGMMSSTLTTYGSTCLEKDHRSLDYNKEENMLSVTYDYNYPDGVSYKVKAYYNNGDIVEKPEEPKYAGYTFKYWALANDPYTFDQPITSNLTLNAVWAEEDKITGHEFTVTFKHMGQTYSTQKVMGYGTVTAPTSPSKTSTQQFKYWSATENGDAYNFSKPVVCDFTLYSVMERRPDVHIVTFNYNGGKYKGKTSASVNVADGKKVKKPSYKPKSSGEYFTGWYDEVDGEDKWDFSTKIYNDTTLYAGWSDDKEDAEDDDEDDDDDKDKDETEGAAIPNLFEQMLNNLAGPDATSQEEITTLSAGSVPKTGVPYDTKPILALFSIIALISAYFIARKKLKG